MLQRPSSGGRTNARIKAKNEKNLDFDFYFFPDHFDSGYLKSIPSVLKDVAFNQWKVGFLGVRIDAFTAAARNQEYLAKNIKLNCGNRFRLHLNSIALFDHCDFTNDENHSRPHLISAL